MKRKQKNGKRSRLERGLSIAVTVLLVLSVMLCVYVVTQVLTNGYVSFGGYMLFRVVTGSMEPAIPVDALLVSQQVDIQTIAVGDIVCFRTQETAIWGKIVTHRVVGIVSGPDGSLLLETKGDANLVMDGYYVSQDNLIGKVIWHTGEDNFLVSAISFFTSKTGFLSCIVFPCLLFAGLILRDSVAGIREELEAYTNEVNRLEKAANTNQSPYYGLSREEYEEMVERIRAEVMEELLQLVKELNEEQVFKTE